MMAWMCRTVWCMLSCARTRLPSWRRIWRVVAGCAASTSGTSAASGAAVASITAPAATADALGNADTGTATATQARSQQRNARARATKKTQRRSDGRATAVPLAAVRQHVKSWVAQLSACPLSSEIAMTTPRDAATRQNRGVLAAVL